MSNAILLVACIAAEGSLVYCFFQVARGIQSNQLASRRDLWNELRSNIAPILVTLRSITIWSLGIRDRFLGQRSEAQLPEIKPELGQAQSTSTIRDPIPPQTPVAKPYSPFATPSSAAETSVATAGVTRQQNLPIVVVATTPQNTIAALRSATRLSAELGAQIALVAVQLVPPQFPLRRPPVSVDSMQQRLYGLIREAEILDAEVLIQLCLCRDLRDGLRIVLRPNSLVILGGPNHWWPRGERCLKKSLTAVGHTAIVGRREPIHSQSNDEVSKAIAEMLQKAAKESTRQYGPKGNANGRGQIDDQR